MLNLIIFLVAFFTGVIIGTRIKQKPKQKTKAVPKDESLSEKRLKAQEFIFWHYDGTDKTDSYNRF